MSTENVKVAFLLADYGHDPTETAIPFQTFKNAGFALTLLTEHGQVPECDKLMLRGWTQKLLGADRGAVRAYEATTQSAEWQNPVSWGAGSTPSLLGYDLVFLPGGHDRGVRQLLDSARVHALLAEYFPLTRRPSRRVCAAVCHGVQALAHSRLGGGVGGEVGGKGEGTEGEGEGKGPSVVRGVRTTALPAAFENLAYQGTRLVLGDYYKTYGAGTANVEEVVKGALGEGAGGLWVSSANPAKPLVVEDEGYNYLSGRWPGDAQLLADRTVEMVKRVRG